jgi:hypothetical protein
MTLPYEVTESDLRMMPYILKEMLVHLAIRLTSTVTLMDLLKKQIEPEYNMILIMQKERTLVINAMVLGIAFGALAIWLVFVINGAENIMTVVAGVIISLGLMQQLVSVGIDTVTTNLGRFLSAWNSVLHILAKQKNGGVQWAFFEREINEIFIMPQLVYSLPERIRKEPTVNEISSFIDEHRWELAYPETVFHHDEKTLLSFTEYAIAFLRERLDVYDRLLTMQQRTGTINPIVFISVGTLVWLLS